MVRTHTTPCSAERDGTGYPIDRLFVSEAYLSAAVLGFAPGDVALANGTAAGAFASQTGTTFVVEITPTEHGRMTIGVPSGGSDAAGNTNRAAVTVEANYIDEAYVHRRTGRVIANFMSRRADHITAKDPDLTGGSPRAAAARGAERHRSQASGTGANNRFASATNLRRIAQAEALKKEAAIAALGAGAMGLGYGGLDSPAIVETGFDISVQGK